MMGKLLMLLITITGLIGAVGVPQTTEKPTLHEQTMFGMEGAPVKRPISIPEGILQLLRRDDYVLRCLREGQSPSEIPALWFVGSEIHLDGPNEADIIVQPSDLQESPAPNRLLFGANVVRFWVFRKVPDGYSLALEVSAHDLVVLSTKSKQYRDIKTFSSTAVTGTEIIYRFNGKHYVVYGSRTRPLPFR